ncbi:MAG: MmcB family DNA repair protein [Acetobacteraceae bacterium]|nr:MmcB family DNA repair protein [Acetobacteraceae bacterium]
MAPPADTTPPPGAASIARGAARLLARMGMAVLHEVVLPDGRRADLLALGAGGDFWVIEVKSGARDFLADAKWSDYLAFCDRLCFAVDEAFPQPLIPREAGLMVADAFDAVLLRDPPRTPLAPARRRALTLRFAVLAARRLEAARDPAGAAGRRAALAGL